MIAEIKLIVENYLNTVDMCKVVIGTVVDNGIKISDKLTVPIELINGNLKTLIQADDKVRLIRNLGGQEFYILEIIGLLPTYHREEAIL